jgi:hypothetical protein
MCACAPGYCARDGYTCVPTAETLRDIEDRVRLPPRV